MPSFDVAHLREQGQDMIIAPLERSFGQKSNSDQNLFMRQLQARAKRLTRNGNATNPGQPFSRGQWGRLAGSR